jgi:acetyl-CoA acetyltransferase
MSSASALRDATCIVGVGHTTVSRNSGVSTLALAAAAITEALDDAGIDVVDVDGLATHALNDSAPPQVVAQALGMPSVRWYVDEYGGGSKSHAVIGQAVLACAAGVADVIVVYRSLNGRSEQRMGGTGGPVMPSIELQYQQPYGLVAAAQHYALMARTHMAAYGTTSEHFGTIAVQQRANAVKNPRALRRDPITLDDYFASPWVVEPFRRLDCCLESDAACAVVVTRRDRARDMRRQPVHVSGVMWDSGVNLFTNEHYELATTPAAAAAGRLWAMAGLGPADVDVAEIYDCFTYTMLVQLEDYGFCDKGDGGPFVASGATSLHSAPPVNTHGGFLSEGYVHGLNHVCEAVHQLRGEAGERQVPRCEVALSKGQPGYTTGLSAALVLRS